MADKTGAKTSSFGAKLLRPFSFLAKMGSREVKSNWAQFLAIIGIGGVAVTLFVGLLANAESIENRVNASYDQGNMADIWVTTKTYDKDDQANLSSLIGDSGSLDTRFEAPGRFARNSIYTVITPGMPAISHPYEISEKAPEQTDDHFVMVDYSLAHSTDASSSAKFQVGATLAMSYDISTYIDSSLAGQMDAFLKKGGTNIFKYQSVELNYVITGIMRYPENVTKASYNSSAFLVDDATFKEAVYALLSQNFNEAGLQTIYKQARASDLRWGDGTVNPSGALCKPNQYLISLNKKNQTQALKDKISAYFTAKGNDNNLFSLNDRSNMVPDVVGCRAIDDGGVVVFADVFQGANLAEVLDEVRFRAIEELVASRSIPIRRFNRASGLVSIEHDIIVDVDVEVTDGSTLVIDEGRDITGAIAKRVLVREG